MYYIILLIYYILGIFFFITYDFYYKISNDKLLNSIDKKFNIDVNSELNEKLICAD